MGIAVVEGVTEAGRQTGIAKQTIHYWTETPEFGQLRTRAKAEALPEMWAGIQIGARSLIDGFTSDAPLHHKAQAFVALAERYGLMSGEATARTETRTLTDGLEDHEKAALRDILDEALRQTEPA